MIKSKFFIIFSFFLFQIFLTNITAVEPDEVLKNNEQELRARNISKNIRCMICQNQSIDESDAPLAKDLRILIRNKIKSGENDKEIYDFLTKRYGDFILLKPAFRLNTLALWFLPVFFLLIGIYVIFRQNKLSKKKY
jgi:cytochrome c-type biogenesis protein CcmH